MVRDHPIRVTIPDSFARAGLAGKEVCVMCGLFEPDEKLEGLTDFADAVLEASERCQTPLVEPPGPLSKEGMYDYSTSDDPNAALYGCYLCEADRGTVFGPAYEWLLEKRREFLGR